MKSTIMTPEITRTKHVLDASGVSLGRLATQAANLLRGKHKPSFVDHLDVGDEVVITNARLVQLTGKKLFQKEYYRHTGWLGHLKTTTLKDLMAARPQEVVQKAVSGMLPHNRLHDLWLKRLIIFADGEGDSNAK